MKRKLTTLVLAMVLAVSGLILVPSSAKAQQCTWTLYVNGQKYSTNSSYYASGQLKMINNVVYLNSFTGQTLQAIPGGTYGDDDAPVLTISLTGTNTLTGGKLDNDTYGMIYSEPRYGGSGAASKVVIEGSGTLKT